MNTISPKIATLFLICLMSLAITGYAYSHWTDIGTIFGSVNMGHLEITIDDQKFVPSNAIYIENSNKTVTISANITTDWQIWVGIMIKNKGTLPVTTTYEVTANNTIHYFSNKTYFYGPYTTVSHEIWNDVNGLNPPAGEHPRTPPIDVPAGDRLVVWQRLRLEDTPPEDFTITITSEYFATFSSWHDTVEVIYRLRVKG